ncbi:MAG: acyltransferase [Chloroflexi bacterium]|nr:acyltransferase [Chloroflexota bacterium]
MDSLDGLRGLAVLLVILGHTSNREAYFFPGANFAGMGKSGVFLFFILSSFLLTYPFLEKGEEARSKNFLLNYAIRRFFSGVSTLFSLPSTGSCEQFGDMETDTHRLPCRYTVRFISRRACPTPAIAAREGCHLEHSG